LSAFCSQACIGLIAEGSTIWVKGIERASIDRLNSA
jgi:hypothetical protein